VARVVVLDASALIALHDSNDVHHKWALDMFMDTVADELVISTLTYAEVLVHPTRAGKATTFVKDLAGLELTINDLSATDSINLAEIRATYAVKMPDAVVLLEAARVNAAVATTDNFLARCARERGHDVYSPRYEEEK
jgi:predicted nucleic acid-binding protein